MPTSTRWRAKASSVMGAGAKTVSNQARNCPCSAGESAFTSSIILSSCPCAIACLQVGVGERTSTWLAPRGFLVRRSAAARALAVISSGGQSLRLSAACRCAAETPSPLTVIPPLPECQPASGTPRRVHRAHARTVTSVLPVCAAARGPVSAAADAASPPDCPRGPLGCQAAASGPPSAWQRAQTDVAPCLPNPPPRGHSDKHRRRCAPPVPSLPLAPTPPHGGSADRCRSCLLLKAAAPPPGLPPKAG